MTRQSIITRSASAVGLSIFFSSRVTAVRPISRDGCSTVVSCGETISASSVPSKPITAISSGTRSPAWAMARSAPAASESATAKTASGRSFAASRLSIAAFPAAALRSLA